MNQNSSGSVIDRIMAWLRGLFGAGKGASDSTTRDVGSAMRDRADATRGSFRERADEARASVRDHVDEARGSIREGVDDASAKVRDLTGRRDQRDTGAVATGGQELPDLGDETAGAMAASSRTDTGAPTDDEVDLRSDFDEAAGDWETGDETYPSPGADLASATHVHDAVGGEDELADAGTDGIIDTTRDADLAPGGTEGYQDREVPLQDALIVDEGASSDEFDGGEITVGDVDTPYVTREDVESAAEGYGDTTDTDLANTGDRGTSPLTGSTYTETDVVVPPAGEGESSGDAGSGTDGQQATGDTGAASGFVTTDTGAANTASSAASPQGDASADDQDTSIDASGFHVVDRYNYGMGDLGIGAGTTPDDAWSHDAESHESTLGETAAGGEGDTGMAASAAGTAGETATAGTGGDTATTDTGATDTGADQGFRPRTFSAGAGTDVAAQPMGSGFAERADEVPEGAVSGTPGGVDASVSAEATRTEIESQSRGDAVNRSDEATQTPGFGGPETFADAETGTTEPSRSATGNVLDEEQDALGTTLDYEEESDAFDEDAANLSAEDELGVSDENLDFGGQRDEGVERVATFQSGTIAHEGLVGEGATQIDEEITDEAYADLPDEPRHATADDAGRDDFAGSDYPSDRIVDTLAGDDFTDAEVPDVPDLDSSAGDLDIVSTDASEQIDYVEEPVERTVGDIGDRLDQDMVGTSDEHVGGEEPEFAEEASRGTDEASFDDLSPEAQAVDEALAADGEIGVGTSESFTADDTGIADLGATGVTEIQGEPALGGMGESDGGASDTAGTTSAAGTATGSVRGDGGTEAPAGYPVKGNANSMIYHLPNFPSYANTKAEYYFATEEDAIAAGYRAPGNVRRGGGAAGASAAVAADAAAGDTGAATGDEGSQDASGETTFDQWLSDDQNVASQTPTGVVTEADASGESDQQATYPPAGETSAATGTVPTGVASSADVPAGAVRGDGGTEAPAGYPVKGNASSMIYHLPSFPSYKSTKAEFYFATEEDAVKAGYRAPGKRNRGRKS